MAAPSHLALALALATLTAGASRAVAGPPRGGTIRGVVRYLGTPPPRPAVDRTSDPVCGRTSATREDVVVTGGKLRDVHVALPNGAGGKRAAPSRPIVIEQTACDYRPRVVGAIAGQSIVVKNGDATMHNVHAYAGEATAFNRSQPKGSRPIEHTADAAGQVLTLKCDVHPWMRAFVPITDHPYFAVTGDDGAFVLADVPPGTYAIRAYHPTLGTKTKSVTVTAGATVVVDVVYP
jgi:plastocyanin